MRAGECASPFAESQRLCILVITLLGCHNLLGAWRATRGGNELQDWLS